MEPVVPHEAPGSDASEGGAATGTRPLRLAVAGKGGSGKTTIAGTLVRLLAERGRRVLAVDGDTNPGLAQTLGLPPAEVAELIPLPPGLLEWIDGPAGGRRAILTAPAREIIDSYSQDIDPNIRLLVASRVDQAGAGCHCRAHAAVRSLIGELILDPEATGDVVVDMEAGLEHFSRGTTRHLDILLVVAEPHFRSMETARRACELGTELGIPGVHLVANKVRDALEAEALADYADRHHLDLAAEIPFDAAVLAADRRGRALLDHAPRDTAALRALTDLARRLAVGRL